MPNKVIRKCQSDKKCELHHKDATRILELEMGLEPTAC